MGSMSLEEREQERNLEIVKTMKKSRAKKKELEPLPSPGKIKMGDYLAIPLGDEHWGYVRAYRDASLKILSEYSIGELLDIQKLEMLDGVAFAGYCEPWDKPTWVFIGHRPFLNESDCWPPPVYIIDVLNPSIRNIYHKGMMRPPESPDELIGMQQEGLCFPGMLVEEIRYSLGLAVDKKMIEEIAPYTSDDERF